MGQDYHLRKKERIILMLFSIIMWQWGHSSTHLFLNWIYWVSVGDTARGTMLPGLVEVITHGSVYVRVRVWG